MICIAVPMAVGVDPACLASLFQVANRPGGPASITLAFSQGIYTPLVRQQLAEMTMKEIPDLEAIAWVDSDMGFTTEDFDALVRDGRAHKDAVVGGYYPSRKFENVIVGRPLSGDLDECWSETPGYADHLGGGFLYVPASIYRALPKPWYDSGWRGEEFLTEDVYFCRKVREKGFRVLGRHYESLGHAYETRRSMRLLMGG